MLLPHSSLGNFVGKIRHSTTEAFIRAADATGALVVSDGFESGASAILGDIVDGLQKVEQVRVATFLKLSFVLKCLPTM